MRQVDLAIIGAGVAGLAAARTAATHGADVLVIERMGAGGQVMTIERVEGMPGFDGVVAGFELGPQLQEAAEAAGAQFMLDAVAAIRPGEPGKAGGRPIVECEGEPVAARAVLIAAGSRRRKLGVSGEEALQGRGVSHCASCDGPFFRGKAVCVVGGGDSGFGEAIVLAEHARHVSIVFRETHPHASPSLLDEVAALPNVEIVSGATVTAIVGGETVAGLRVRQDGVERDIAADGVFVYAGLEAETSFLPPGVKLDPAGRIETDARHATAVPGVYAAGDIRAQVPYRLSAVAQDGERAADFVCSALKGNEI